MDTQKTIDDISLLGGHPALDFVNTVDSRGGRWGPDFLNSYDDLVAWAHRLDVIDDKERDALLVTANRSGRTPKKNSAKQRPCVRPYADCSCPSLMKAKLVRMISSLSPTWPDVACRNKHWARLEAP